MKKLILSIFLGIIAACPVLTVTAAPSIGFGQVIDNLDGQKNTKLHVEEYWKFIKGQEVTWSGEVTDVDGGSSKAKLYVADKSRPLYDGYNIIVTTSDVSKASNIKKGQLVRFKGILDDYNSKKPGAVIKLKEAQIL
jgi:hypothetical protein